MSDLPSRWLTYLATRCHCSGTCVYGVDPGCAGDVSESVAAGTAHQCSVSRTSTRLPRSDPASTCTLRQEVNQLWIVIINSQQWCCSVLERVWQFAIGGGDRGCSSIFVFIPADFWSWCNDLILFCCMRFYWWRPTRVGCTARQLVFSKSHTISTSKGTI